MEALIALTIGGILMALASTLFLVQNQFYGHLTLRASAQDNARSATSVVAEEARSVAGGGVIVADSQRMALRRPLTTAVVCGDGGGGKVFVHLVGGPTAVAERVDEVAGFAVRSPGGAWTFVTATWASIHQPGGSAAGTCATSGADTAGAASEFTRFSDLGGLAGVTLGTGDLVMIFGATELRLAASELHPGSLGLFRGEYGGTLTEYASGLTSSSRFAYRYGDTIHYRSVASGDLALIDGIRFVAVSEQQGESGQLAPVTFSLTYDQLLRNVR